MQIQTVESFAEIDLDRHIFLNLVDELNHIIGPLVVHFGLDSFNYHKIYNDNSYICMTNQPRWKKHYLINKLYQQSIYELPANNYSKNRIISSNIDTHSEILADAKKFNINTGIALIEPSFDGCEFYFLGTTNNKIRVHEYLSNFLLLEKFVANFHNASKNFFAEVEKHRLIIKDRAQNKLIFNTANNINKYDFLSSIYDYKLTVRELECLPLLLKGFSAKQIAECLQISFRTVEEYINHIKLKTNTTTKGELLSLLAEKFA